MGWDDHNIDWLVPGNNIHFGGACRVIADAINERWKRCHFQHSHVNWAGFPLIAIEEDDINPNATGSLGQIQYDLYSTSNQLFNTGSSSPTHPLGVLLNGFKMLMRYYGRTDIVNYQSGEPRDIKELGIFGGPQTFHDSAVGDVIDHFETITGTTILGRIDSNDPTLVADTGGFKKEIVTDLFNVLKHFKYMYHKLEDDKRFFGFAQAAAGAAFDTAYSAYTINELAGNISARFTLFTRDDGDISHAFEYGEKMSKLGDAGFTSVPDLVTPLRANIVLATSLYEAAVPEALPLGYRDLTYRIENGTDFIGEMFITPGGTKPVSVTQPSGTDDWGQKIAGTVTTGSGPTTGHFCFDLSSGDFLEYDL